MKTSIATVSISGVLDSKLRAVAAAGFSGAEVFENDLLSTHLSTREIAALMQELGLACTMFQPFRDLEGLPEPQRARAFDRLERKFDTMAELGTDLLLVCSSCSPLETGASCSRIFTKPANARRRAACGSAMKHSLGASTSTIIVTPGAWSAT
jgi:4-hydroxyphenylpyruvate dioxygenase